MTTNKKSWSIFGLVFIGLMIISLRELSFWLFSWMNWPI